MYYSYFFVLHCVNLGHFFFLEDFHDDHKESFEECVTQSDTHHNMNLQWKVHVHVLCITNRHPSVEMLKQCPVDN